MSMLERWACVLALLLPTGLASQALAQDAASHTARLEAKFGLTKPEGTGPFPAVVMVTGCQGFEHPLYRGRYERFARDVAALGFVSIRADYLAAAAVGNCELIMDPEAAAKDILTAARHLRTLPFVKQDAINVVGWSYGGGLSLGLIEQLPAIEPRPIATVIVYSPYLALFRPWTVDLPVLIICTMQDTVAPCDRVDTLLAEVGNRQSVQYLKFPEGSHAFDNADLPPNSRVSGNPVGYHEPTAKAAWVEVARFLRRCLEVERRKPISARRLPRSWRADGRS
ncbi:hypothetical protein BURC_04805 [Burkholderiaceae bacterium]|nr:hypothetical protein BURC_04805 [Burkholderiaceae bacterium]